MRLTGAVCDWHVPSRYHSVDFFCLHLWPAERSPFVIHLVAECLSFSVRNPAPTEANTYMLNTSQVPFCMRKLLFRVTSGAPDMSWHVESYFRTVRALALDASMLDNARQVAGEDAMTATVHSTRERLSLSKRGQGVTDFRSPTAVRAEDLAMSGTGTRSHSMLSRTKLHNRIAKKTAGKYILVDREVFLVLLVEGFSRAFWKL